ncbi:MAG: DnaJ domain-containing protein [Cyanobacteriota bacterium]
MAMGMGGERRTWVRSHAAGPRITSNSDALQAENYLLRQEVLRLRQQLDRRESRPPAAEAWSRRSPVTSGAAPAQAATPNYATANYAPPNSAAANSAAAITADQVRRWGEAMTRHRRWHQLRVGAIAWHSPQGRASAPGRGLKGLIDQLLGAPSDTAAAFEQQLERRWPGLGEYLRGALQGPASKARLAVRAAFAMLGPTAASRLDVEPLAVVELLIEAIGVLEVEADAAQTQRSWTQQPPRQQRPQARAQATAEDRDRAQDPWGPGRRRAPSNSASQGASPGASRAAAPGPAAGTARSGGNRRTTGAGKERPGTEAAGADPKGADPRGAGPTGASAADQPPSGSGGSSSGGSGGGSGGDRRQLAALETLGLAWGASRASIKAAHRRLVKQHHPDMGGDAESFRLVNDAYQLLIA